MTKVFLCIVFSLSISSANTYLEFKSKFNIDSNLTFDKVQRQPELYFNRTVELKADLKGIMKDTAEGLYYVMLKPAEPPNIAILAFANIPADKYLGKAVRAFLKLSSPQQQRRGASKSCAWELVGLCLEAEVPPETQKVAAITTSTNIQLNQPPLNTFNQPNNKPIIIERHFEFRLKDSQQQQQHNFRIIKPSMSRQLTPPRTYTYNEIFRAYRNAIKYLAPNLKDTQLDEITSALLEYSQKWGVDARLVVAMVAIESGFNPYARSHKGAMGLGQLMPATASALGVSQPYDAKQNLWGSIRLIRGHLDKFRDNPQQFALALACYNAGSGAVKKYGGVPPYRETVNYIKKVAKLYRQLCGYKA